MQHSSITDHRAQFENDFLRVFQSSAGLDAVLMGYFDGTTRKFTETWTACSADDKLQLLRTASTRLATFAAITEPDPSLFRKAQRDTRDATVDAARDAGQCVILRAGSCHIWLGRQIAGLFPVMAFRAGPGNRSSSQRALLRVGMAHVTQALGRHVYSRPVWSDELVEATLKMLSIEFFVVGPAGEIHLDGRSGRSTERGRRWLVHNERLSLRNDCERAALAQAIATACSERRGAIVSVTTDEGELSLAAVAPFGQENAPRAIILFESPHTDYYALREHFFRAFGLTRSESAVAHELLSGKTPAETSEATGLSISTVRSYLKTIFDKTGAHRQSELISLYYRSILPVGQRIASSKSQPLT
ncbi:helix-turn-helix transcriptional regulator [Pseudooceanicola nanhaiensis]|uniref:helix-turn-helix transcriptional regulator n=1 Tax=Pseudooceanicola nanhaiensis TaxID=375761 RepID=UPI001CD21986|nr:helix-turn-helix transcriptional regulator [Pseudooceanicola nanhaiensis]MCA0920203.1 helix-turn-helix transcriptional regulator [Pseudooceanicola nanhaiensis]